jgi:hypothetical protein
MSLFGQIQGEGAIDNFSGKLQPSYKNSQQAILEVVEIMTDWKRKISGSREKGKM